MDGLTSHLNQSYLGESPEAGTAADAANEVTTPDQTPEGNPMPSEVATVPGDVPILMGMTRKQLIILGAAALIVFAIMRSRRK